MYGTEPAQGNKHELMTRRTPAANARTAPATSNPNEYESTELYNVLTLTPYTINPAIIQPPEIKVGKTIIKIKF